MTRHLWFCLAFFFLAAGSAASSSEPIVADDMATVAAASATSLAQPADSSPEPVLTSAEKTVEEVAADPFAGVTWTASSGCGFGSCNTQIDCFRQSYFCPSGTFKTCWDGTGSGCEGTCGCG